MTTISKVNAAMIKLVREDLRKDLAGIEAKYGLTITQGNASYTDQEFNMKISFRLAAAESREESDYELYRAMYDLPALKTKFNIPGKGFFSIVGFKSKARKNSLIIQDSVGKTFVCQPSYVKKFIVGD